MRRGVQCAVAALPLVLALLITACAGLPLGRRPQQYEGTKLTGAAAGFNLVDQNAASISLSGLKGSIVVLTFMDTQCHDVCPQTAGQFRAAYRALGRSAGSVVFLGVNVNLDANAQSDVIAATDEWQLTEIPSWHFLRGAPADLQAVWKAYGIAVSRPSAGGDLIHTTSVYIIDQTGEKRWYISISNDPTAIQASAPLSDLIVKHVRAVLG